MTVEVIGANSLPPELNPLWPMPGDFRNEGDDHIRNLKLVMQKFYADYSVLSGNFSTRLLAVEAYVTASNATQLGGQAAAFYRDAANINAGILAADRLTGTYGINITGNAATATLAANATNAGNATTADMADDSEKLGGLTLAQLQATLPSRLSWSTVATPNVSGALSDCGTFSFGEALAEEKLLIGRLKGTLTIPSHAFMAGFKQFTGRVRALPSNKVVGFFFVPAGRVPSPTEVYLMPHGSGSIGTGPNTPSVTSYVDSDAYTYARFGIEDYGTHEFVVNCCETMPSGTTGLQFHVSIGSSAYSGNTVSGLSFEGIMQ